MASHETTHYADGAAQGLEQQMDQMSIVQGRGARKKKTRHVLDASVHDTAGNGFAKSQFLSQGTFTRNADGSAQEQASTAYAPQAESAAAQNPPGQSATTYQMPDGQLPNIAGDAVGDEEYFRDNLYYTDQRGVRVPPANIDFSAIDHGTSNPKFARLSLPLVPMTDELMTACQMPLSLVVQPFAELNDTEGVAPTLDYRNGNVPRCHRCRTYMNPYMQFQSSGNKFVCNICGFANDTLPEYYSPVDMNGRRQDWAERFELQFGTCDFLVGKDFWSKDAPPKPVHILFAIDVSEQSLARGVSQTATEAIRNALYSDQPRILPEGAQIAIMTFDRSCHFYNLSPSMGATTQMLEVPDVNDMFVPLMNGLFADPSESRATIEATLERIGYIFREDKSGVPEPALGAVTRAAYLALGAVGGGKLSLFLGALPTWGPGKLRVRDKSSQNDPADERNLYDAADVHWKNIAEEFVGIGVGVDCFLFPNSYIDLATIGLLSQTTGGDIFFYPNFYRDRDGVKFQKELLRSLSRAQAFSIQMRLRCSNGIKVDSVIGHCHPVGPSDLQMGSVDADKAITFILKHESKLVPQSDVYFQSAILYTNAQGQRVLRTHNVKAIASSSIAEVLRNADSGAAAATLAKIAAVQVLKFDLKAVKQMMTDRLARILTAYRKNATSHAPQGELLLPDNLRTFPAMVLAIQKQFSFRTDSINSDVRVNNQRLIKRSSVRDILSLIYPRLLPLHNLQPEDGFADAAGRLRLPPAIQNTFKELQTGGAYLCDDGQQLLLWLHRDVHPNLLQDLFGPEYTTLESVKPRTTKLPVLETLINVQVRNIIYYLNTFSTSHRLVPQIVRQSFDSEAIFANSLVEDRNGDNLSYPDYLALVHRRVQFTIRESQKQSGGLGSWISGNEQAY